VGDEWLSEARNSLVVFLHWRLTDTGTARGVDGATSNLSLS
jgi:hypothetical protein